MTAKRENTIAWRESSGETFPEITNKVLLRGILEENFTLSYQVKKRKFYQSNLVIRRLSNFEDSIPIIASGSCFKRFYKGDVVEVKGYVASEHVTGVDGKKHLKVYVMATKLSPMEEGSEHINEVYLDGYIPPTTPILRTTALGRVVSDVYIINNMSGERSAYIPCIAWGEDAKKSNELKKGNRIRLIGRIQSREYFKKINDSEERESHTVYEVSVKDFEQIIW